MNGTAHAVIQFDVDSGKDISMEDTCFGYVPDDQGIYNVPSDELLNSFVIGLTLGTVICALI